MADEINAPGGGGGISDIVEDTSPQLGGDLDLNGNSLDFPTTPNISDVLDEDDMTSDSATALATQQSIKAYVDANAGGGASWYDATVGATGADYTHVGAAVDDSKYRLLVIDDTTEDADIAVPSTGLYIHVQAGANVNMGIYDFTKAGAYPLYIKGDGWESSEITIAKTSGYSYLINNATGINIIEDILIDNNGTQTGVGINGASTPIIARNVKVELPDKGDSGFYLGTEDSFLDNVWIVGGGSNCQTGITQTKGGMKNIYITGTWWTTGYGLSLNGTTGRATNIAIAATTKVFLGGVVSNVWQVSGTPSIEIGTASSKISNVKTSRPIQINANTDGVHLTGVEGSTLTIGAGADNNIVIGNFTSTASIDGDNNRVIGRIDGAITVETNADFTVVDCHTNQAITDNGTSTVDRTTVY